ncbi:MAG: hypothetical protein DRP08_04170 [Candidatus Aenigmatarchaeota archaeon]|nr:MAG: hypothetical protein DRP08_04170 [Candidatus Aenigmarchaeota archaeon]
MPKKKKNYPDLPRTIVVDNLGDDYEVRSPALVALFHSKKLRAIFRKDPKRKFCIQELLDLIEIPLSKSAIQNNIKDQDLFETKEGLRYMDKGIKSMNLTRLKAIAEKIFDKVEELQDDEKD